MKDELYLIWKQPMNEYKNNEYIFNYFTKEINDAKKVGFDYFPGFPDIFKEYSLLVKSVNFESPFYDEKIIVKLIF